MTTFAQNHILERAMDEASEGRRKRRKKDHGTSVRHNIGLHRLAAKLATHWNQNIGAFYDLLVADRLRKLAAAVKDEWASTDEPTPMAEVFRQTLGMEIPELPPDEEDEGEVTGQDVSPAPGESAPPAGPHVPRLGRPRRRPHKSKPASPHPPPGPAAPPVPLPEPPVPPS